MHFYFATISFNCHMLFLAIVVLAQKLNSLSIRRFDKNFAKAYCLINII